MEEKPVLNLTPRGQFQQELVALLRDAGCSYVVSAPHGNWLVCHSGVPLNRDSLKELCDSIAQFRDTDGSVVGIPPGEAKALLESSAFLGHLTYRWEHVRHFLRDAKLAEVADADAAFGEYQAWCASNGKDALGKDLYGTAVRDDFTRGVAQT